MNTNEELITRFYTCFQNKDYKGMQDCYSSDATFSDPVFNTLNSKEVKAMWEMLIKSGKDLNLEFKNVKANDKTGSSQWVATYTFSRTGRQVINSITAEFEFEAGKIKKHRDHFNFHKWAGQALGIGGRLLGWTPFIKNKVQATALNNLRQFMSKNPV